ncbi:MAG: DUF1501 domain-containing protein [Pseudomonadota bacterium]
MSDPILVVIFLRGGADALNIVSPTADQNYIAARPDMLRVARGGDAQGIRLGDGLADVEFRMHRNARELADLFAAGDLSVIHATGLTEATRSHFDAEAQIERAASGGEAGGWLGRWLEAEAPGGPLPALAVGTAMPESLRGYHPAVAKKLSDLTVATGHWLAPALQARLADGFGDHGALAKTSQELLALSKVLEHRLWMPKQDAFRTYSPSVKYPGRNRLSPALMTVAQSIKEDLGLRVATVDYGGWDTHANQQGTFDRNLRGLSLALMAFWRDLGPRQQDVSVVVMSEFGRRLRSNASGGTDHGRAGAMLVLGPQSKGGRLLGRWPGLHNDALEMGADLAVTTDYRAVLSEIMAGHMGLKDTSRVFPGLDAPAPGLFA